MKCQFCSNREADRIFYVDRSGTQYQLCVCDECMENMWRQAVTSGREESFRNYAGWWPGKEEIRKQGAPIFPEYAGEKFCRRRELGVLSARLSKAAAEENYEEAARLRDDIEAMKKEVCTHEL